MIGDYLINSILSSFVLERIHRQPDSYLHVDYETGDTKIVTKTTLPEVVLDKIRIIVVSDTHDCHHVLDSLPKCDLFVHCGDIHMLGRYFTKSDAIKKLKHFNHWLSTIPAKKKIIIAGNHDHHFLTLGKNKIQELLTHAIYLENDFTEYENIKIWGTPISIGKSDNTAFQTKDYYEKTMQVIPSSTDILITHGPYLEIQRKVKHKLHICGHKHNSYGIQFLPPDNPVLSICAPLLDGRFRIKHLPVIVDYPLPSNDLSSSEKVGTSVSALSDGNLLNRIRETTTLITGHTTKQQHKRSHFSLNFFQMLWTNRDKSRKVIPIEKPLTGTTEQ